MKIESRKLVFVAYLTVFTMVYAAFLALITDKNATAGAENAEYIDTLKAGAALILDADITQTDSQLIASAIELNGGAAIRTVEEDTEELVSQENTLVMANVQNALNVREEPSTDAKVAGQLYADCGGEILDRQDGWTLLQSGNLIGWAKDDYLLFGDEALALAYAEGVTTAEVKVSGLAVRTEANTDSSYFAILAEGDVVPVYTVEDGWALIDCEGNDGYVQACYLEISLIVDTGETAEEIKIREEEEAEAARQAEEARLKSKEALLEQQIEVSATYTELQILAALIYCEAGNQPYDGQVAVGAVVMNRVNCPAYPNTITAVIYSSGQFTPIGTGRVYKALENGKYANCLAAAQDAMNGVSPVGYAMHFRRVGNREGIVIGAHVFW